MNGAASIPFDRAAYGGKLKDHQESEPQMDSSAMFAVLRGRSLLLMLLLATALPLLSARFIWPEFFVAEVRPLPDAIVGCAVYALLASLIWVACKKAGIADQISFGHRLNAKQVWIYSLLGIPLVGVSVFGLYSVYLPLSYAWPDFVVFWVLDVPPLIWWEPRIEAVLASGVNAIVLVAIAPVVEELFFRGFLLNRWHQQYGPAKAVVFSSMIFALFHVDVVGGLIFGAVLSAIYMKTKSLFGPIVIHMSNNAIVFVLLLVEGTVYGGTQNWTLDEFRAFWWLGPLGAVIGIPWIVWFCRKSLHHRQAPST
jgi:hypothetical protein